MEIKINFNLITMTTINKTPRKPRRSPSPSSSGPSTTFPSHDELKTLSRNITAILDAFSANYDKRVRPNYGGEFFLIVSMEIYTRIYTKKIYP